MFYLNHHVLLKYPPLKSSIDYVVSTQFQGVDRIFNAIVRFNRANKKDVRFVICATEGPNFAPYFFLFLRAIGEQ